MNGRSLLKSTLFLLNVLFSAAFLLSSFAHWIDPNLLLFPAFFGLLFLPLLFIQSLLTLGWLLLDLKVVAFNLLIIALSWSTLTNHISFGETGVEQTDQRFSLMSFNVRLFDLYNWKGNKTTRNQILEYLVEKDTDIHCFQEFFNTNKSSYFNTLDTLMELDVATHVHEEYTAVLHDGMSKFGIATLSQPEMIRRERIHLDTAYNNIAILTDIVVAGDTIRVYNIHLASVHLSGLESEINKHLETNDQQGQWEDLKLIAERLATGFKRRANQARVIKDHVNESPHPVIVLGDLNDTPGSYAYHTLSEGLQDAFLTKGQGIGSTYIGLYPMLRIDFMFVDERLSIQSFETDDLSLSDHRPIRAEIGLARS